MSKKGFLYSIWINIFKKKFHLGEIITVNVENSCASWIFVNSHVEFVYLIYANQVYCRYMYIAHVDPFDL